LAHSIDITKEFRFDAAHCLPKMGPDHPYTRLHGHSFRVEVTIAGGMDPVHGWICDFAELESFLGAIRAELDHHTLNDLPGLEQPTLETIACWIFDRVAARYPGLASITLYRDSIGERCTVRAGK